MRVTTICVCLWLLCGAVACQEEEAPRGSSVGQTELPDENNGAEEAEEPEDRIPDEGPEEPVVDPIEPPRVISGIETVLGVESIEAGAELRVTCQLLDERGDVFPVDELEEPPVFSVRSAPDGFLEEGSEEGSFVPFQAGEVSVSCAWPQRSLTDLEPALLSVVPGPPHTSLIELSEHTIVAGESVEATCRVLDAWGNVIEGAEPQITLSQTGDGIQVGEGGEILATRTGLYEATCEVPGAPEVFSDTFEVSPGLPSSLVVALSPSQDVYAVGQVVQLDASVLDRFGNDVPGATLDVTSNLDTTSFGQTRVRLNEEGVYSILVEVNGETERNFPLESEVSLIVNGTGPDIECTGIADGSFVDSSPGVGVSFRGRVSDANGVASVMVSGQRASLSENGEFEVSLPGRFGINFAEIKATDNYGEENNRLCSFLVSDDWISESGFFENAVSLRLAQAGVDDGNRSGGIGSLGDLLHTALSSPELKNTIHNTLLGQNPLKPNECVRRVLRVCVYRLSADYRDSRFNGPNTVDLDLVDDGLRARVTLRDIRLNMAIGGTISLSGWVNTESITADVIFDLGLAGGQPNISIREVREVEVGRITTDLNGLAGWVVDLLFPLFRGLVQGIVRDQIEGFITGSFNQILDGAISGLDIESIGANFPVPSLDGGENLNLGFGVRFSSLDVDSNRALFGLGTRFTWNTTHGGNGPGIPQVSGRVLLDPASTRSASVGVHMGVLNQALFGLWRGGLFDATLSGGTLGASDETSARIETSLPPVAVQSSSERVKLMLGGMKVTLAYPEVLGEPMTLRVGAVAEAGVRLVNGDELRFERVEIQEFHLSADGVSLDASTQTLLENFLRRLIQRVVDQSLNNALPALPIPSFDLPDSLSGYGIPAGTSLGLRSPDMSIDPTHIKLESDFGTL